MGKQTAKTPSADAGGTEQTAKAQNPELELRELPITSIDQGEQLIRSDQFDDALQELAADIATHGLLQPIGVTAAAGGRYQLLWGGRRIAAYRILRRTTILARVYDRGDADIKALALVENLQRRNMTLAEECDAVHHLHVTQNRSPEQIASALSKGRDWVLRRLAVRSLPDDIAQPLLEGLLTLGAAEKLALLEDLGARTYARSLALRERLSVSQVDEIVKALLSDPAPPDPAHGHHLNPEQPITHPEPLVTCPACQRNVPLSQTVTVRICAEPCTAATDDPTPNPANAN